MIKKYLILFLGLFISQFAFSQVGLKGNHYAITKDKDTLRGFIEEIGETRITIASIVKNEYRVMRLSTKTVVEYNLNDTIYRSVPVNVKKKRTGETMESVELTSRIFLKLLIDGPVALYERNIHRLKLMDPSANEDAKGFLLKIPINELYLHYDSNQPALIINETNFYASAKNAMGHKRRIKERLNSGYYTFENLEQLILDYNYLSENNLE